MVLPTATPSEFMPIRQRQPVVVTPSVSGAPAGLRVQVEVESEEDAVRACDAGADFLLLDNCTPDQLRAIVARLGERALLEASGGIGLGNVREVAETGQWGPLGDRFAGAVLMA